MITISEYASKRGVVYEAVRKQVKKYKESDKEFAKHIQESTKRGTSTLLDDWAVEFLDGHRHRNAITVETTTQEVKDLKAENEQLLKDVSKYQDMIIKLQAQMLALAEEKSLAIEDKTRATTLLEQKDKDLEESKAENQKLNQEIATKNQELNSYQKTIFGLYKKINL